VPRNSATIGARTFTLPVLAAIGLAVMLKRIAKVPA
jgi:hypothetical protein